MKTNANTEFLHTLLSHFNIAASRAYDLGIPLTRHHKAFLEIKDKHANSRAFIIGMGPSLRISDLDAIAGEITFGCNKCYLAFDQTPWRPTYYCVEDLMVLKNNRMEINGLNGFKRFFPSWSSKDVKRTAEVAYYNIIYPPDDCAEWPFSFDAAKMLFGGYSVVYLLLQLAVYTGVKQIYLLGMDYTFNLPGNKVPVADGYLGYRSAGEINHFHPDYRKPGEAWVEPKLDMQWKAFHAARQICAKHGVSICNATRGGKLDVFPRVDFDSIV